MTPDKQESTETSAEFPTTEVYPFMPGEPRDPAETRPDVPAMEQLPHPDALPDPGYPEMLDGAAELAGDLAPAPGSAAANSAPANWPGPGPVSSPGGSAAGRPADGPGSPAWPHPPAWPAAAASSGPAASGPAASGAAASTRAAAPAAPAAPAFGAAQSPWPAKASWAGQPVPSFRPGQPGPQQPAPAAQRSAGPGPADGRDRPEGSGPAARPEPAWTDDAAYAAAREPDEAPPLRGPAVPWDQVRASADHEAAAEPLAAPPTLQAPPASGYPGPVPPASGYHGLMPPDAVQWPADAGPVPRDAGPVQRDAGPMPPDAGRRPLDAGLVPPVPGREPPAPRYASPLAAQEPAEEYEQRPTSEALTSDALLRGKRATPDGGWRQTIFRATGGLVRVGESSASLRRRDLVNRIRTPVAGGHYRVAVLSLKGGVGKTTATVGLGATLASLRGDRVIAVDGNPDRGTLSDKVVLETSATIRDLLNQRALVGRYADVRAFTSQASSRLEILASDRDPGVSVAFSADDYRAVAAVLEHYYSICITDCGTGLLHSAMAGILELADQIVLVSSPSVDGARSASATLDWLEAHSYGDLVRDGVVVLSAVRRKSRSGVDLDRLEQHFAARCRAVVRVPYDTHLEEGAEFELGFLDSETAEAYMTLAALVADGFPRPRHLVASGALGAPLA